MGVGLVVAYGAMQSASSTARSFGEPNARRIGVVVSRPMVDTSARKGAVPLLGGTLRKRGTAPFGTATRSKSRKTHGADLPIGFSIWSAAIDGLSNALKF
jgi:hypothetical protein